MRSPNDAPSRRRSAGRGRAVTLVEILVAVGLCAVIGTTLLTFIRSGRKEVAFTSEHLQAVILSQKVSEDLIEELMINPYGIETLGIDTSSSGGWQDVTDGRSVFFSMVEDRRPPWGVIDPNVDGTLDSSMKPLYESIRRFRFRLAGERLAASGDSELRNLVNCGLTFQWPAQTGQGEAQTSLLLFSPAAPKNINLAYTVDEAAIDAQIPAALGRPGANLAQIAADLGENVETLRALGRISLVLRGFASSDYFRTQEGKIRQLRTELSRVPPIDLARQYEKRLAVAKAWYDLAKSCFQVVAYLVSQFDVLRQKGRLSANPQSMAQLGGAILQDFGMFRIIYEYFVGSLIQARYYYYSLLQRDLARYKGGKVQLQTILKLIDLYRIGAVLPTRPQGKDEYLAFLRRVKDSAAGRNPFLTRLVEYETHLLGAPDRWLRAYPNLERIHGLTQGKIPETLAFIRAQIGSAF